MGIVIRPSLVAYSDVRLYSTDCWPDSSFNFACSCQPAHAAAEITIMLARLIAAQYAPLARVT